jgi:ribonuclease-3
MGDISSSNLDVLPYNCKNNLINESDVMELFKKYDINKKINDINIYRKSLVHKSYCTRKNENFLKGNIKCPHDVLPLQEESNERYEFFGDSILNMTIADYLFERYPDENEGFLTRMRTKLVNGKMLAFLSEKVGFNKYIVISKQIEDNEGRMNLNILEDAFEAFIAAIYLDFGSNGFNVAREWIINIIESHLDFSELIKQNNNYKDLFLKYYQQNFSCIPRFYEMCIDTNNNTNGKIYTICIKDKEDNIISIGKGHNKKEAENDAAKTALAQYT